MNVDTQMTHQHRRNNHYICLHFSSKRSVFRKNQHTAVFNAHCLEIPHAASREFSGQTKVLVNVHKIFKTQLFLPCISIHFLSAHSLNPPILRHDCNILLKTACQWLFTCTGVIVQDLEVLYTSLVLRLVFPSLVGCTVLCCAITETSAQVSRYSFNFFFLLLGSGKNLNVTDHSSHTVHRMYISVTQKTVLCSKKTMYFN